MKFVTFWLIHLVFPPICGWNDIDSFVSTLNMLFSSFVNSTANCNLLSNTMLSKNSCNFYMLSLNNLANSSTDICSIIATKCVIFNNLLHTTKITSFPANNSNFMMKFTVKCIHSLSNTSFNFNFTAGTFILFFIL